MFMSGDFILALASAVAVGAAAGWTCRHLPDRESPKSDLEQVGRLIESASTLRATNLNLEDKI